MNNLFQCTECKYSFVNPGSDFFRCPFCSQLFQNGDIFKDCFSCGKSFEIFDPCFGECPFCGQFNVFKDENESMLHILSEHKTLN